LLQAKAGQTKLRYLKRGYSGGDKARRKSSKLGTIKVGHLIEGARYKKELTRFSGAKVFPRQSAKSGKATQLGAKWKMEKLKRPDNQEKDRLAWAPKTAGNEIGDVGKKGFEKKVNHRKLEKFRSDQGRFLGGSGFL